MRAVMGMVGAAALADEGGDLLGRESVAGPHRGPRLPAARRSTVETDGVVLRLSQRVGFSLLVPLPAAMLCVSGAEV